MDELQKTATDFTAFYYAKIDDAEKRAELKDLYNETSMMTWEGDPILGQANIVTKLASMPKVTHQTQTMDVQPSSPELPNLLVSVKGLLWVDDSPPMQFHQVFQLIYVPSGKTYYIQNDIFRLILN